MTPRICTWPEQGSASSRRRLPPMSQAPRSAANDAPIGSTPRRATTTTSRWSPPPSRRLREPIPCEPAAANRAASRSDRAGPRQPRGPRVLRSDPWLRAPAPASPKGNAAAPARSPLQALGRWPALRVLGAARRQAGKSLRPKKAGPPRQRPAPPREGSWPPSGSIPVPTVPLCAYTAAHQCKWPDMARRSRARRRQRSLPRVESPR